MKNETSVKHKRFYTYRHQLKIDKIEFLTNEGEWSENFDNASLLASEESTKLQAKNLKAAYKQWHAATPESNPDWIVCMGAVDVITDGLFVLVEIE